MLTQTYTGSPKSYSNLHKVTSSLRIFFDVFHFCIKSWMTWIEFSFCQRNSDVDDSLARDWRSNKLGMDEPGSKNERLTTYLECSSRAGWPESIHDRTLRLETLECQGKLNLRKQRNKKTKNLKTKKLKA